MFVYVIGGGGLYLFAMVLIFLVVSDVLRPLY